MIVRFLLTFAVAVMIPQLGRAAAPRSVLILPVAFTDTSGEPADQSVAHARRTAMVADELAASLAREGAASPTSLSQAELDAACPRNDGDCLLALARGRGIDRVLVVETFKTSSLILEAKMNLVDVASDKSVFRRFVSFRGDSDISWRRLGRFLGAQAAEAGR